MWTILFAVLIGAGRSQTTSRPYTRPVLNGELSCPPGFGCPPLYCCTVNQFCSLTCADDEPRYPRWSDVEGPLRLPPSSGGQVSPVLGAYWSHDMAVRSRMGLLDLPVRLLTHVYYAFARVGADLALYPGDPTDYAQYDLLNTAVKQAAGPGLQALISIGGPEQNMDGSPTFWVLSDIVSDRDKRTVFIRNLIAFTRLHRFDGIDLDWEFPGDPRLGGRPSDKPNFVLLMQELHEAIGVEAAQTSSPRLLLTLALLPSPSLIAYGYDLDKLVPYIDWINIMTYELHYAISTMTGPHSALSHNDLAGDVEQSIYQFNMVPPDKLSIGMSLFSKAFELAPGSSCAYGQPAVRFSEELPYRTLQDMIKADPTIEVQHDNPTSTSFFCSNNILQTFDMPHDAADKISWLQGYGMRGAFIWTVNMDTAAYEMTTLMHNQLIVNPNRPIDSTPSTNNETLERSGTKKQTVKPTPGANNQTLEHTPGTNNETPEHAMDVNQGRRHDILGITIVAGIFIAMMLRG